jgi:hypothetical protein
MSLSYTVRPISDRTPFTGKAVDSQFTATWWDTLELLERELTELRAAHVVIEVDVPERAIRADGMLRADAKALSPAVRVAFDSKHGPLQYATDRFQRPYWQRKGAREDWQHNVRAIALGLEALRKVDRYGITKRGEQYAGWKALPPGSAVAMPGAMTIEDAARFLIESAGLTRQVDGRDITAVIDSAELRRGLFRQGAHRLHPDRGGDVTGFNRLQEARELLDTHGGRP